MASSAMELQLGIFGFSPTTHRNKRKQNASTICAHRKAFHVCLFSHSDCSTCTHLTNHGYFDRGKKPKISPIGAHARIRLQRFRISGLYLWFLLNFYHSHHGHFWRRYAGLPTMHFFSFIFCWLTLCSASWVISGKQYLNGISTTKSLKIVLQFGLMIQV